MPSATVLPLSPSTQERETRDPADAVAVAVAVAVEIAVARRSQSHPGLPGEQRRDSDVRRNPRLSSRGAFSTIYTPLRASSLTARNTGKGMH